MGGDAYYTSNIWGSIYQRVLVLAMGSSRSLSSCNKTQLWGWTGNDLSSTWSELGRSLGLTPLSFLVRVFDDGSGIRGRSPVLLWGAASLSDSALELQSWHRYPLSSCRLQSTICSRFSLLVVFLGVLSIVAPLALVDCLLRSHHQSMAGDVTMGASAFSL